MKFIVFNNRRYLLLKKPLNLLCLNDLDPLFKELVMPEKVLLHTSPVVLNALHHHRSLAIIFNNFNIYASLTVNRY
jgi:hypothetical protein